MKEMSGAALVPRSPRWLFCGALPVLLLCAFFIESPAFYCRFFDTEHALGNSVGESPLGGRHQALDKSKEESTAAERYYCTEREHTVHSRMHYRGRQERYLAIFLLPEQLSKARHHLAEFMKLARELNRTLILPRVGSNFIGMVWEMPMCTYVDVEKLGQAVDWITEDEFFRVTQARNVSMLPFVLIDKNRGCGKIPRLFDAASFARAREVSRYPLQYSNMSGPDHPIATLVRGSSGGTCLDLDHLFWTPGLMEEAVKLEIERRNGSETDVLVFTKVSIQPFVSGEGILPMLDNIQYARKLVQAADVIGERLGVRYVGVHWRMEKCLQKDFCTPHALRVCAQGLVETIRRQREEWRIAGVFIASDISTKGAMKSASMGTTVRKEGVEAATHAFRWMVGQVGGVMWEDVDPELASMDAGIQGILDKLAVARAQFFLRPPKECGGGLSSYAREVGELRSQWQKYPIEQRWTIDDSALLLNNTSSQLETKKFYAGLPQILQVGSHPLPPNAVG